MTPEWFLSELAKHAEEFIKAIQTGAQWEIFAHVAITNILFSKTHNMPIREFKYKNVVGASMGEEACDLLVQEGSESYAIELKVESATNRGQFAGLNLTKVTSLNEGVNKDAQKLGTLNKDQFTVSGNGSDGQIIYSTVSVLHRWVLVIAWSPTSVSAVKSITGGNIYTDQNSGIMFWLASI